MINALGRTGIAYSGQEIVGFLSGYLIKDSTLLIGSKGKNKSSISFSNFPFSGGAV